MTIYKVNNDGIDELMSNVKREQNQKNTEQNCKHQNGYYSRFDWWIFSWKVYWCEDCLTLLYSKKLEEFEKNKPHEVEKWVYIG